MRIHGIMDALPEEHRILRIYPSGDSQRKYPPGVSFSPGKVSRLWEFLSPVPRIILNYEASPERKTVAGAIRDFDPDLVIASGLHVIPFVPRELPFFYDAHNIEWHLAFRLYRHSAAALHVKLHRYITFQKLRHWEKGAVNRCAGMTACSSTDGEYFGTIRGERVPVVFNGVDSQYWALAREPVHGELLFCGDMGYYPNEEAVVHVVKNVLPLLRGMGWKGRFVICGRNPSRTVRSLTAADVAVTGTVDDVRPYYRRASMLLAPMLIGSGTPLKVVTALAAGLPVVTTGRIAESLNLKNSGVLVEADTPEETAGAVMRLLSSSATAMEMSVRGRNEVEKRYSWKVTGKNFWKEMENFLS